MAPLFLFIGDSTRMFQIILVILLGLAFGFLVNAGIVWVICWGLKAIGVTAIFGWEVAFSWPLVVIFTIVYMVVRGLFKSVKE